MKAKIISKITTKKVKEYVVVGRDGTEAGLIYEEDGEWVFKQNPRSANVLPTLQVIVDKLKKLTKSV